MEEAPDKPAHRVDGGVGNGTHNVGRIQFCRQVEIDGPRLRDRAFTGSGAKLGKVAVNVGDLGIRGRRTHICLEHLDLRASGCSAKGVHPLNFRSEVETHKLGVIDLDGSYQGCRGCRTAGGDICRQRPAPKRRPAWKMDAHDGQQVFKLLDGNVGGSKMQVDHDSLLGELEGAIDMHCSRSRVHRDIRDSCEARSEIVGDRVVHHNRVLRR